MAKAANRYIKDDSKRIEVLHFLIEKGHIKTWSELYEYIPRTVIASHLGINNTRMKGFVSDPSAMSLAYLVEMAIFLNIPFAVIADMAYKAMPVAKRVKKKN